MSESRTLTVALNKMANTLSGGVPQLTATAAANKIAGTTGLALVGALNNIAGTSGRDLAYVLNLLGGSSGLDVDGAATYYSELADRALLSADLWIDAADSTISGGKASNLGTAGSTLDAQLGSSTSADSNDPLRLVAETSPYVYLPGLISNNMTSPDSSALDITGDIDVRVRVAADDWTPASTAGLAGKWDTASNNSWLLWVNSAGTLSFYWTADGSTNNSATSTVATGFTDGAAKWVRATLDVNNGASGRDIKFFTSDDGATWTQLGTTVTQSGTTSIFSGTSLMKIGDVASTRLAGKFYRVQVRNGIDGTVAFDADASVLTSGSATSFTETSSNAATVTINRSASGRKTVAVVRNSVYLMGTDDYLEVPDNSLLDFGSTESLTFLIVGRAFGTAGVNERLLVKAVAPNARYLINNNANSITATINDGTNNASVSSTLTVGTVRAFTAVVDRTAQTLRLYNGITGGSTVSTSAVGSLANSNNLRAGFGPDSTNAAAFEFAALAVFRRALTRAEVIAINNYYQARYP